VDPAKRAKYDAQPSTASPVTEAVELVAELVNGAQGIDPARAGLRVLDKVATPEGRRELRGVFSALRGLLS
jgi:hypothetical protein